MSEAAKLKFDEMLKFCERPSSRVRFNLGDGDWQETPGPEFLRQLKGNQSGKCQIAWVADVVHGENG